MVIGTDDAARDAARFDVLAAVASDLVWIADADGRITAPLAGWERFTGTPFADYRGTGWIASLHPDDRTHALDRWQAALADGAPYEAEFRVRRHDGAWRVMRSRAGAVRDGAGRIVEWIGVHVDITEQREAERARDALADEYRWFMEVNPQVPWVADADGRIVDFNQRWLDLTGMTREQALGEGWTNAPHPDDLPAMAEAWGRSLRTGEPYDVHHRIRTADGSYRWMHTRAWPRRDGEGRVVRWYGTTDDVHAHVIAQEAVAAGQRQLLQAQKLEAVGRLAGGVAHDFANMLTAIGAQADLAILELPHGHAARHDIQEILRVTERAGVLVRKLLDLGRSRPAAPRRVAIGDVVRESEQLLRRAAGAIVSVVLALDDGDTPVRLDPAQLELVLMNLVINARDAMRTGGAVTIATRTVVLDGDEAVRWYPLPPGPVVELAVRDTGTGMDAATLAHIFEPFFTTKDPGRGTGLGLPTCLGIVTAAGGVLKVASTVGQGTTFTLRFPVADGA